MRLLALSLLLTLFLGLGACQSTNPVASDDEGAFVTLLGEDTLAVEQFRRTPEGMEAEVVLRTPETTVQHYRLDLDEAGALQRYEATARAPGAPAEAPPLRRTVFTPVGDSLQVTVTEDGATQTRTIAGDAQALPFVDMVHWPFELMLTRALASGQDSVTQELFTERGTLPFVIGDEGGGRMTVTHPFRGTMEVDVDEEGRLVYLDAGATTRKLTVTRVPEVDLEGLAQRFAAQDEAGHSFGPLSGRGETTAQVKGATIAVDYGQPAKRGREIFGTLVPWGELWRTGANRATHFTTDRTLSLGGLEVPPGQYTLYTVPEPDGGTLILNRQTGQGGTTYDPDRDLGRVAMTRRTLQEPVELFRIDVEETDEGGLLELQWDRTAFVVPFTIEG